MSKSNMKQTNRTTTNNQTVGTVIQNRIVSLLDRRGGQWVGSMTELGRALRGVSRSGSNVIPTSPSVLRKVVNTVVHSLRRNGVRVEFGRETDSMRKRFVNFATR
jgi:hypothetical protein